MRRPSSGDDSLFAKLTDNPRARFRAWRRPRPLLGGLLLIIGGLLIGYVPIQFASELMLIGGAFTIIGLLFAALVAFCGIAVLAKPQLSTIFGVFGIAFSTLSLFGALGGLFVGMLVGTIGGVLSYSWEPPEGYEYEEPALTFQRTGFIWQEASEFIWHAGPDVQSSGESEGAPDTVADGSASDETSTSLEGSAAEPALADGASSETAAAAGGPDEASPVEGSAETAADEWMAPTGDEWGAPTAAASDDEATAGAADGEGARADTAADPDDDTTDDGGDGDTSDDDGPDAEFDWDADDGGDQDTADDEGDQATADEEDDVDWDETDIVDDRFEL